MPIPLRTFRPTAGIVLLASLLIVAFAPLGAKAFDAADDEYKLAYGLYKQNRWTLAAEKFRSFVKEHPKHPKRPLARLLLGLTLVNLKEYEDARDVLRGFVKDYPTSKNRPDAMYRVGECSYMLGDYKEAEEEFLAFRKAAPDSELGAWALPYLGDSQLRLGKPDQAAETFRQAIEKFPKGALVDDARFGLARSYEKLEKSEDAETLYAAIASERTGSRAAEAQLKLATLKFDASKFEEAAREYLALVENFPESDLVPTARLNAGYANYELSKFNEAAALFEKAAKDDSLASTALYWKGISLKASKDYQGAVATFRDAFGRFPEDPSAPNVLFQWADCDLRQGKFDAAQTRFLEVVNRWPENDLADQSLHFAGETALQAAEMLKGEGRSKKLDEADRLVARFARDYAKSGLRFHQSLLKGRIELARGNEAALKKAVDEFRGVLEASRIAKTQDRARFHLAVATQKLGDHRQVLEMLEPLLKRVREEEDAASELVDAFVIDGVSAYASGDFQRAETSMGAYLERLPSGPRADRALATSALAAAEQKDSEKARAYLTRLRDEHTGSPLVARTTHELAEIVYARDDFEEASDLFAAVVERGKDASYHGEALSGLAWCQFKLKQFDEAAEHFQKLAAEHGDDETLGPEARYMVGQALQADGKLAEAATAYETAFAKNGTSRMAYLSGLQAARTRARLDEIDEANEAYETLLERFPKPEQLDRLLDEWAALNVEAEEFAKADEIFKRLIREAPKSKLVYPARLSLAESDMLAGRLDAARKEFLALSRDAKADAETRERALYQLIQVDVGQERWKDVRDHAERHTEAFPKSGDAPYVQYRQGEALFQQGQFKEAIDSLQAVLAQRSNEAVAKADWLPHVWVLLADASFRLKKYDDVAEAVKSLEEHDSTSPFLPKAYLLLGQARYQKAQFDEARDAYQRALTDHKGEKQFTETAAEAQFRIAETYLVQKDYKTALVNYLEVHIRYEFPEWQAPALYQAGLCDEAQKQWKRAAETYTSLISEFPKSEFADKAKQRLQDVRQKLSG